MMYSNFADIYDRLMQDIPYEGWICYLHKLFHHHNIKPTKILDLGCGTGNVTIPLSKMGYQLTGLDMSSEMLSHAEQKSRSEGLNIRWLQQDMRELDFGGENFDLAISMTDSLNYIDTKEDLQNVFSKVKDCLSPNGWFIFDLNSAFKIREVFGNNTFTFLEDDIAYIWENSYDTDSGSCEMDLTFFVKEADGKYRRFSEAHIETGYEVSTVCDMLEKNGFIVSGIYKEDTFEEPEAETERIYFVSQWTG